MSKTFITSEEAAELHTLYAELPSVAQRAAAAVRSNGKGQPLEGEALARLLNEEVKVHDIVRRIREILGTTIETIPGQNWMEP
jgi:hypothetical protein